MLGFTAARAASTATEGVKQIIFSHYFSIFELGGITKHLMAGPSGNSEFCFPSTLNVLGETKLTVLFPLGHAVI